MPRKRTIDPTDVEYIKRKRSVHNAREKRRVKGIAEAFNILKNQVAAMGYGEQRSQLTILCKTLEMVQDMTHTIDFLQRQIMDVSNRHQPSQLRGQRTGERGGGEETGGSTPPSPTSSTSSAATSFSSLSADESLSPSPTLLTVQKVMTGVSPELSLASSTGEASEARPSLQELVEESPAGGKEGSSKSASSSSPSLPSSQNKAEGRHEAWSKSDAAALLSSAEVLLPVVEAMTDTTMSPPPLPPQKDGQQQVRAGEANRNYIASSLLSPEMMPCYQFYCPPLLASAGNRGLSPAGTGGSTPVLYYSIPLADRGTFSLSTVANGSAIPLYFYEDCPTTDDSWGDLSH